MDLRHASCYVLVALCIAHLMPLGDTACTGQLSDLQSTAGTKGFSLFYQGLQAVNVSITNTSTLTILAPLDAAFSRDIQAIGLPVSPSSWTDAQKKLARGVLLYHILPGQIQGQYLNRTNPADLKKTVVSKVDTFVCGPGSVIIPLNDTDPIDNISSVSLDFSDNSTIIVTGLFKSATANVTEISDPCFSGITIYTLDAVILPCNTSSVCALADTVSDTLMAANVSLAPLIANEIPDQMVNGTIMLPSDAAYDALYAGIMALFKEANVTLAVTKAQLLMLPQLKDVLDYHVIPTANLGAAPASGVRTSLLASTAKQTFCTAPAAGTVKVTAGTAGKFTITDGAGVVANGTVRAGTSCNGIIYDIDAVLLPCGVMDSIVAGFLVKTPTASPAASPKTSPSLASPTPGKSPAAAGTASPTPSPAPGSSSAAPMSAPASWAAAVLAASLVALLLSQ